MKRFWASITALLLAAPLLVQAAGQLGVMRANTGTPVYLKGGDGVDILPTGEIRATGVVVPISIQPWSNISSAARSNLAPISVVGAFTSYTSAEGGRATNDRVDFLQGQVNTQAVGAALGETALQPGEAAAPDDPRFPTTAEKAAMIAAAAPSGDNPFATRAELQFVNYSAASVTVAAGGAVTGAIHNTHSANDTSMLQIGEVAATPGFDARFTFTDTGHFNQVSTRFRYAGATNHDVYCQIYNYGTTQWDALHPTPMHGTTDYAWVSFTIPDNTAYVSGGTAQIRFYHSSPGNPAHVLYVDYIALQHSSVGGANTLHSQLTGRSGADSHPIDAITNLQTALDGKMAASKLTVADLLAYGYVFHFRSDSAVCDSGHPGNAAALATLAGWGLNATNIACDSGFAPSNSVALLGVTSTGAVGTITVSNTGLAALTGVSGTGAAGTLTATAGASGDAFASLTGVAGSGAAGTLGVTGTRSESFTLAGVAGTGAAGTLGVSIALDGTVTLTGASGTGVVGTLTASAGGATFYEQGFTGASNGATTYDGWAGTANGAFGTSAITTAEGRTATPAWELGGGDGAATEGGGTVARTMSTAAGNMTFYYKVVPDSVAVNLTVKVGASTVFVDTVSNNGLYNQATFAIPAGTNHVVDITSSSVGGGVYIDDISIPVP